MPVIASQPAAPAKDTLSLRLDRASHEKLKAYAEYIASSKDYVISQALHRVFRQDREFASWLASRADRHSNALEAPTAAATETGTDSARSTPHTGRQARAENLRGPIER
jgi:hypothetical protein